MTDKWTIRYTESSFSLTGLLIFIVIALVIIGVFIAVAYGGYNATNEMLYGDNWTCGYITNMTNLTDIRNCYRD